MSDKRDFPIEIVTPVGMVFSGQATHVMLPGADGYFGVLPHHTPLTAVLSPGRITVDTSGGSSNFATSGGFVEITPEGVTLLAETAESPEIIDVARAEAAVKRAEQRLSSGNQDIDLDRARAALLRALNRLRVVRNS